VTNAPVVCTSPCQTCTTSTSCLTCIPAYYLSGTSCLICMKVCKTCTAASTCATCFSGTLINNVCTCSVNLFFDTASKTCKSCSTMYANCQTCGYNGTYTPVNPPNVICTKAVPNYYVDSSTGLISNCLQNCLNCTSGSNCLNCKPNFIFSHPSCVCNTSLFYNSANGQCQACSVVI